ncbi:MAG TPA: vWA domain-containing protein [Thermoplasmata archaeon]|nr:vWA domain-containing protein [Thermoplasmata archaeon]
MGELHTRPVIAKGVLILGGLLAASLAAPASSAGPAGGDVLVLALSDDGTTDSIPPYIDALDGTMMKGAAWSTDPSTWPHTATIAVKGAAYGQQEARVKLRIEGKGDPIKQNVPQQTILVTDDSGSMTTNDPNNMRVSAMDYYIDQLAAPDEIGIVWYADRGLCPQIGGPCAETRVALSSNYQGAKAGKGAWNSQGGTPIFYGFQFANDELIPKVKQGFSWAVIHLTDGCFNTGGSPQTEVDRMTTAKVRLYNIGLYPDPNSNDKAACEPQLQQWSQQTGAKYYWVQNPNDLQQVYQDIANSLSSDTAGKPPKSGVPMLNLKITDDIEVVPQSFVCDSSLCSAPNPSNAPVIVPNNKGLKLEWNAPVTELKIKQVWQVEFGVRSYTTGRQIKVNDIAQSYVEYDRYDGSPGGSDVFEQLYVDVVSDIPGVGGAGLAEPPSPPPPPPHGGIPQLIPQPQQVPITYIQNLPVLHGVTQVQGIPLQYLLGSAMGMAVADRVKMKSRIKQGVKIAMASM